MSTCCQPVGRSVGRSVSLFLFSTVLFLFFISQLFQLFPTVVCSSVARALPLQYLFLDPRSVDPIGQDRKQVTSQLTEETGKEIFFEEAEKLVVCRHAAVPAVGSRLVESSQSDQRVILDR